MQEPAGQGRVDRDAGAHAGADRETDIGGIELPEAVDMTDADGGETDQEQSGDHPAARAVSIDLRTDDGRRKSREREVHARCERDLEVAPAVKLSKRSQVDRETVVADADGDEQQRGTGEDDGPAVIEVGRQEARREWSMRWEIEGIWRGRRVGQSRFRIRPIPLHALSDASLDCLRIIEDHNIQQ